MVERRIKKDPLIRQIEKEPELAKQETQESLLIFDGNLEDTISTRSDLLDLAISGGRKYEGGIPRGIIIEISGPSSTGKTQLMGEICSAAQKRDLKVKVGDVEGKFIIQYARKYGLILGENDVTYPDTPEQLFQEIMKFDCDVYGADSVAALVASTEMQEEDKDSKKKKKKQEENSLIKDKMGGMKPKEIHALMRKTARLIKRHNILLIFTNQLHDSMSTYGPRQKTSGGNAIPYYSMLRMSIKHLEDIEEEIEIPRKVMVENKEEIKMIKEVEIKGIECEVECFKNHIDDPFRTAPIRIRFGYGFDNVGANLQWIKEKLGENAYCIGGKRFRGLDAAIRYVEENNLEGDLTKQVREIWHGIRAAFENKYKRKERT